MHYLKNSFKRTLFRSSWYHSDHFVCIKISKRLKVSSMIERRRWPVAMEWLVCNINAKELLSLLKRRKQLRQMLTLSPLIFSITFSLHCGQIIISDILSLAAPFESLIDKCISRETALQNSAQMMDSIRSCPSHCCTLLVGKGFVLAATKKLVRTLMTMVWSKKEKKEKENEKIYLR